MITRVLSAEPVKSEHALGSLRAHLQRMREHTAALRRGEPALPGEALNAIDALDEEVEDIEEILSSCKAQDPASPGPLEARVNESGDGPRPIDKPSILVAEDDPDILSLLSILLADLYSVSAVDSGDAALSQLLKQRFDLAIFDVQLPGVSGFELAEQLRERPASAPRAIMYLSAQASPEFKTRGLLLGAADYMTKPFDAEELLARVARIIAGVAREEQLRLSALTDLLTGLANYRAFVESLEREFARSQRYEQPLCVLTIDLDHLKAINDSGGHEAGNEAIREVALVLKEGVRSFELVARHGGDEFSVLLPNTSEPEALLISERLRTEVARRRVLGRPLSISIGLGARAPGSDLTLRQLVAQSDDALYLAKRTGRNRVASANRA